MKRGKSGLIIGIIVIAVILIFALKYLLIPFAIIASIFVIYKALRTKEKRWLLWLILTLALLPVGAALAGTGGSNPAKTTQPVPSSSVKTKKAKSKAKKVNPSSSNSTAKPVSNIAQELINDTNQKSPGANKNYYWDNGPAQLSGFNNLKAGDTSFAPDNQGRSGVARAILTYSEYQSSQGGRQGEPLNPPAWPADNPKVAINFSLTGRTYHGHLYNRSHSIADSLLGKKSYTSEYNFTTGTRSQNVGANQDGGMRAAEELAENYWKDHPNSSATIDYQTTPVYNGNETIPRGSIVDEKSSDGALNIEIVVINDAEGITINYNSAAVNGGTQAATPKASSAAPAPSSSAPTGNSSYTTAGGWSTAASGMVFVSKSGKYYSMVTNPNNYNYMSQSQADSAGYTRAERGNEYARP